MEEKTVDNLIDCLCTFWCCATFPKQANKTIVLECKLPSYNTKALQIYQEYLNRMFNENKGDVIYSFFDTQQEADLEAHRINSAGGNEKDRQVIFIYTDLWNDLPITPYRLYHLIHPITSMLDESHKTYKVLNLIDCKNSIVEKVVQTAKEVNLHYRKHQNVNWENSILPNMKYNLWSFVKSYFDVERLVTETVKLDRQYTIVLIDSVDEIVRYKSIPYMVDHDYNQGSIYTAVWYAGKFTENYGVRWDKVIDYKGNIREFYSNVSYALHTLMCKNNKQINL